MLYEFLTKYKAIGEVRIWSFEEFERSGTPAPLGNMIILKSPKVYLLTADEVDVIKFPR